MKHLMNKQAAIRPIQLSVALEGSLFNAAMQQVYGDTTKHK